MNTAGHSRRSFMKTTAAGALAAALYPGLGLGAADAGRKPNVVILFIDDLGYGDLACFGNKRIPTPHIDSLAAAGVKGTMSYITNPPAHSRRTSRRTSSTRAVSR